MIINILFILLNSRLWQNSILLYRLIITKNTFWPICCNPKHAKRMPEFLYHINSHAHSTEFRTKFTGLKFVMFITIPIYEAGAKPGRRLDTRRETLDNAEGAVSLSPSTNTRAKYCQPHRSRGEHAHNHRVTGTDNRSSMAPAVSFRADGG